MNTRARPSIRRLLRSPKLIVAELVALALLCALGAAVPQADTPAADGLRLATPALAGAAGWLGLDRVFRSPLFLAVTALTAASLSVVIFDQLKRLRLQWSARLTEAHFGSAPFRAEFEVDARSGGGRRVEIWTERRAGLLGSPVFHLGLLLIILAGALRALFESGAVVDLCEGETLPPTAAAWAAQFPGLLGKPFRLDAPVTLEAVKLARYGDGALRDLKAVLGLPGEGGAREAEIAVNHDLNRGGSRLFLGSDCGPAALVEWQNRAAPPKREAALLKERGGNEFEGTSGGPEGEAAYLRASVGQDGARPTSIEVRIVKGGALLFAGELAPGEAVSLPGGGTFILHGAPFWARLRGSRDPSLWLAYAGFALVMAGATAIFGLVKRDCCVAVSPAAVAGHARVFVALKPHRFAPLFRERFDRLVARQHALSDSAREVAGGERGDGTPARWAAPRVSPAATSSLLLCAALLLPACGRPSASQARQLVERYNRAVSEAYRRGDVLLVDPVVGPNEGKKLAGLIGVRLDAGITLDSEMLWLEIAGVERSGDEMRVRTRERWRYRDRKIGTGEMVGEESTDAYEMLYLFKRIDEAWLVDEIRFAAEPQVGRKQLPFPGGRAPISHGFAAAAQPPEAAP